MFNKLYEVDSEPTEVSGTETPNRRTDSYFEVARNRSVVESGQPLRLKGLLRVVMTPGSRHALPVEVLDDAAGRIDPEGER